MATKLLLLKDVECLGRSGDIVSPASGYARNFLIPQKLGIIADKQALLKQQRLKDERIKRAVIDKKESQEISERIQGISLTTVVKVDHDGHMYGSVAVADIIRLLHDSVQVELDKKSILLNHPIKTTGVHTIEVRLKEDVNASFNLKVMSEEAHRKAQEEESSKSQESSS